MADRMSKGIIIRESAPCDNAQLVTLWHDVFGDPHALIEGFLSLLPSMGIGCVADQSGKILGAAYLIHGFTLSCPGSESQRCGYLYAVAVAGEARGYGLGTAVSRGAAESGRQHGAELLCTLPAEESLYRWYGDILSLRFRSVRTAYTCKELPSVAPLSPEEYLRIRETLLQGLPHVIPNPAVMAFQEQLCKAYGGGLYCFDGGILCACQEGDHYAVSELLLSSPAQAIPEIFVPRTSSYLCSDLPFPDGLIWNLTLD